jgi:hypothetical protein
MEHEGGPHLMGAWGLAQGLEDKGWSNYRDFFAQTPLFKVILRSSPYGGLQRASGS